MRNNNYILDKSRQLILLLAFIMSMPCAWAIDTSTQRSIYVATAGTLSSLLPQEERSYVKDLTLTGKLNGTDFNVLKAMGSGKLSVLDISDADIVSGGESYYTNYGTKYYTHNNEIGYSLFNGYSALQKLVLPNSATSIGQCAFWYCRNLETLVVGPNVTAIKPGLWGGCSKLTDVQLSGNANFHLIDGILYNKDYTVIIAALQTYDRYGDLTIRNGVKEIWYNAFSFCKSLTSVAFPSSVTKIGDTAFEYTGITSIKFTGNIKEIGSFAFSGCNNLKKLDLTPLSLTELDYGVFMTSNVEKVYLPKKLATMKQAVFSLTPLKHIFSYTAKPASIYDFTTSSPTFKDVDVTTCVVHVPKGCVNKYKSAAGWKEFRYITDNQNIDVANSDDLQDFINSLANNGDKGTEDNPKEVPVSSDGLNIDNDINMEDDLQLFINGAGIGTTERLVVKFTHGVINNNENSGWRFGNVVFSDGSTSEGQNVKTYANRTIMTKVKGFINSGKLTFANCELSKGDYRLENNSSGVCVLRENSKVNGQVAFINNGIVYLDGTCSVDNILNKHDGRIYFMDAPKTNVKITIENIADIDAEHPIIMGTDGYVFTNDDMEFVAFDLPEGYKWYYDFTLHAVFVTSVDGVPVTEVDAPQIKELFNISGQSIGMSRKGIYIQKMTDGTTRKIIIK